MEILEPYGKLNSQVDLIFLRHVVQELKGRISANRGNWGWGLCHGDVYQVFVPFRRIFNMGYLYDVLLNVWGNRLRNEQIIHDLRLLKEWIAYYW